MVCTTCGIEFTWLEYYFTEFYIYLLIVSDAIRVYCTRAFWDHRLEESKQSSTFFCVFVCFFPYNTWGFWRSLHIWSQLPIIFYKFTSCFKICRITPDTGVSVMFIIELRVVFLMYFWKEESCCDPYKLYIGIAKIRMVKPGLSASRVKPQK